jgi:hypothetical protein
MNKPPGPTLDKIIKRCLELANGEPAEALWLAVEAIHTLRLFGDGCAAGCGRRVFVKANVRPRRFCSNACRQRTYRAQLRDLS